MVPAPTSADVFRNRRRLRLFPIMPLSCLRMVFLSDGHFGIGFPADYRRGGPITDERLDPQTLRSMRAVRPMTTQSLDLCNRGPMRRIIMDGCALIRPSDDSLALSVRALQRPALHPRQPRIGP